MENLGLLLNKTVNLVTKDTEKAKVLNDCLAFHLTGTFALRNPRSLRLVGV